MTKCPFCDGTGQISNKFKKMPEPCFCGGEVYTKESPVLDSEGRESLEVKSVLYLCMNCGIRAALSLPIAHDPADYPVLYRGHKPDKWKLKPK
jgi:hypothetical protein